MKSIGAFCAFFSIVIALSSGRICAPDDILEEHFCKLAMANNELAFNLYREMTYETRENIFFSPLSISTAFGVLFYGARGETAEELREVLGYEKAKLRSELVHDAFGLYFIDVLNRKDSSQGYVLNSANALIADSSVDLLEEYCQNVEELYKVAVLNEDLSTENLGTVQQINAWVEKQTNGTIQKFMDNMSPATGIILLNAVYFKGTWKTRFDPSMTRNEIFFTDGWRAEAKMVPMMYLEAKVPVAYFEDFKALELPYRGGNVSMLILVPNEIYGLEDIEDSLTPELLTKILKQLYILNMEVLLPKFKLEFEEELSEPLQILGANRIFGSGADFSGMTPSEGVFVSEVFHKAMIEVNEEGSVASAATRFIMFKSGSLPLIINRPFLFLILEKNSEMVLFMGRVNTL